MNKFLPTLITALALPIAVNAEDQTFEIWEESHFKIYPFECVEDGTTPEYTRCIMEDLLKNDWNLKQELKDEKLLTDWRKARSNICYYYANKQFGKGTVKTLMQISCEMRLNSEVKRYCITGEDKQCG